MKFGKRYSEYVHQTFDKLLNEEIKRVATSDAYIKIQKMRVRRSREYLYIPNFDELDNNIAEYKSTSNKYYNYSPEGNINQNLIAEHFFRGSLFDFKI